MTANQHSYAVEKLTTALATLVSHPGDARERLYAASLSFSNLSEKDFQPELQKNWRNVMDGITKFGVLLDHNGQVLKGPVENTMRRIKNKTASEIITRIYEMYWSVRKNVNYQ